MAFLKTASVSLCAWTAFAAPHGGHGGHGYPTGYSPTVNVRNGTIAGVHSSIHNQDYFLGVPFAQPPVGGNRFRVPQSLDTKFNGTYDASRYSAACIGYGSDDWPYPSLSEDCLYLNVIRPSGYEKEKLPVAFWIHGGGLTEGSGIDQRYNLTNIVQRGVDIGKPIIGVSINYRLSMWGFVTGQEAIDSGNANLGFRDQRLALHWVQENIEAFGGDCSKVTIWGESAGALSVGVGHLTAFGGRDDELFRGAIMQSGNPINYNTFNYSTYDFVNASTQLGCGDAADKLDCLRAISTDTLSSWINSTAGEYFQWQPIIDGDYIQGKGSVQLANGDFVHVPIIDGANSDEGTAFGIVPMNTTEQFLTTLQTAPHPVVLTSEQATKVLEAYPANITYGAVPTNQPLSYVPGPEQGAASRRSDAYYGDVTMIASRRKTCETWSANGLDTFCYRFNTIPHGIPAAVGATHFQEVAFVFDNKLGLGYGYPNVSVNPFEGEPQSYFDLADTMSAAWVSFVHDLNPGSFWPKYDAGALGRNWVFDANVTGLGYAEDDDWRKEGMDLINAWNEDVYDR
ncbi:Alpha/Beta hydrolase protein [Lophiotrema nucula]|uniref:Carboxylic ester hydrolase n=1 Tax=Lophiotrema nucula TaxID=690887 RepID=A0A6A5Z1C6_9PLEO|nr:Alpha/Beta hydrolase protein [Lophiotrema nucula]